ncbi:hypothetical protein CV102_18015 [Natronococcus pandeyae]|uniref:NAD-dependent epimerase/dehydratase domain-containing protein n=1 Tax=Natronococcus pandeyae TaxID=2055836 RepID=A0A8J8Q1F0_9EURY|nr:hypothetical protein CV102_18015 [Natronococcus pandeyae]
MARPTRGTARHGGNRVACGRSPIVIRPPAYLVEATALFSNILETMQAVGVSELAYTSTSTVYGEAPRPTPEDYAPLEPISAYGASKLADEGLCSTYAHSHELTVRTFRFANIVGSRLQSAVLADFTATVYTTPETALICGTGRKEQLDGVRRRTRSCPTTYGR